MSTNLNPQFSSVLLCLLRIAQDGGWCLLPDQHEGDCVGKPSVEPIEPTDFGPVAASKRRF